MGGFLFSNEKRLLRWPSQVDIPKQTFDLNKLNEVELKLLCKAEVEIEDGTEGMYLFESDRTLSAAHQNNLQRKKNVPSLIKLTLFSLARGVGALCSCWATFLSGAKETLNTINEAFSGPPFCAKR